MAEKRWTNLNPENVSREPMNRSGVYLLQSRSGQIVYIGQGRLHESLSSHLVDSGSNVIEGATKYWYKKARNDEKAQSAHEQFLSWFQGKFGDLPVGNGGAGNMISPEPEVQELPAADDVLEEAAEETPESEETVAEEEASENGVEEAEEEPSVIADGLDEEEEKSE